MERKSITKKILLNSALATCAFLFANHAFAAEGTTAVSANVASEITVDVGNLNFDDITPSALANDDVTVKDETAKIYSNGSSGLDASIGTTSPVLTEKNDNTMTMPISLQYTPCGGETAIDLSGTGGNISAANSSIDACTGDSATSGILAASIPKGEKPKKGVYEGTFTLTVSEAV